MLCHDDLWGAELPDPPDSRATIPAQRMPQGRLEKHKKEFDNAKIELVFMGDSIMNGWRYPYSKPIFEKHYSKYVTSNFSQGGDTTANVLWRMDKILSSENFSPKLVVLLIGINNLGGAGGNQKPVMVRDGVVAILKRIHKLSPKTKVLLLGTFPAGAEPTHMFRPKVKALVKLLKPLAANDPERIYLLDIGHLFLEKDGTITKEMFFDQMHLAVKAYHIWANAMEPHIERLMK
jgi:lysophospholipase L1-like esterase